MTCTEKVLAIDLYHTTRGIGLTQIEVTNRIEAQLPNEQIPTPSLYRTSLVQFEAKIEKTFVGRTEETQSVPGSDNIPRLSYDVVQAVESCSVNLAPISGLINSVGEVKVGNTKYRPARVDLIDPKFMRISNLRNYVMQAANPATPMPLRLRMFNLNSIPGAVWQNDLEIGPLLINPDDIIPEDYGIDQMRHDFLLVKACLGRISRKMPKYIGQVKFIREGNPGQLVSTVLDRDPPRCQMLNPGVNLVVGDAEDFYVSRELAHSNVISGVLSLLGEVETEAPAQIMSPWSISRAPHVAISSLRG